MKKYQVLFLVLLMVSLFAALAADGLEVKSTDHYSISIPSDWEVTEQDGEYVIYHQMESGVPVSIVISAEEYSEEDAGISLEELSETVVEKMNSELVEAGMGDLVEITESTPIKVKGKDGHRAVFEVSMMGITMGGEIILVPTGDMIVSLTIVGFQDDLDELSASIDDIKKSFIVK